MHCIGLHWIALISDLIGSDWIELNWIGLDCADAEISSITGLQQQIKAAFGRWRKRGAPSSSHAGLEEEVGGGSNSSSSQDGHRIREDSFDHPLNVRLSAQSRTFSHPHRLTVFPPFPSGVSSSSSSATSPAHASAPASTKSAGTKSSSHPFAFVRGLRKRRGEGSESTPQQQHQQHHHHLHHLTDPSSDRVRSRTDGGWTNCSIAGQDYGSYPLASKSRSDHSLHRILKDDNTWTVFATLRPPCGILLFLFKLVFFPFDLNPDSGLIFFFFFLIK